MDDTIRLLLLTGAAGIFIAWLALRRDPNLDAIPAIGNTGILSSYKTAFEYMRNAIGVVQQGYEEHRGGVFRVARIDGWQVIATGDQRVAEINAAPEHVLSFRHGATVTLQPDYTMGSEIVDNAYHEHAVRSNLTRNLGRCMPQVVDEITQAFNDVLALENPTDWKAIPVLPSCMKIVARTTNRLFVGIPLCRNQEYLDLCVRFAVDVFTRGAMIHMLPDVLKIIIGPLLSTRNRTIRRALHFLGPMISERLEKERTLGPDWEGKPNDLISWLLEYAEGKERTTEALTLRVLVTNMVAVHTSSAALTHALYDLTTYPEYILPLREEAARVVDEEGWSKTALNKMHKIDSFLRESQRIRGGGATAITRKVVAKEGFKFSDGVIVPYGCLLSVANYAVRYDGAIYENAAVFDGFRFSKQRAAEPEDGKIFNHHMVSTGIHHLIFGHGKHACPGRFFAATELKTILAHILLTYDIKAETEGLRPANNKIGTLYQPNRKAKILFRKRQEA